MTFFLSHSPDSGTAQGKRLVVIGGRPRFYKAAKMKKAVATLEAMLLPHKPAQPVPSPVRLTIHWEFPWRKSETKRNMARGSMPHTKRPDLSNLIKELEDLLSVHRFIEDDAGVAQLVLHKTWGNDPGISIRIEPLEEA